MPSLRIVSVNDVYSLENLPRLKNLARHHAETDPADAFLFMLAGDFLAPSLLSSIDGGRGMVDCLNAIGVTHVILGNHEDDIPLPELELRLRALTAVCDGTNVGLDLPRHAIVEVAAGVRVGIVGVVLGDVAVYRREPFGGVTPAIPAALAEAARLAPSCAAVIALTHQAFPDDRALALAQRDPPFPVIIGGHEHVPMLVDASGTWIVKAGSEAVHAVVIDIVLGDGAPPRTTVRLEDVSAYPEDTELRARVDRHLTGVRELAAATLFHVDPRDALSSVGTRSRQTTLGSLLGSRLRDCLGADACVFNGGGIRASRDYPERFTYGDIEAEVPFDNEIVVIPLTGEVLRGIVAASRARAPAESGAFLQVDDTMVVESDRVVAVAGAHLEPERVYQVAVVREMLLGLDHIEPLVRWAAEHPELVPPAGSGREPKLLLVQSLALGIWNELGGFETLDTDRDDRITAAELAAGVARTHPSEAPSAMLVDIVLRAVDADADHAISREEAAAIRTRSHP